MRAFGSMVLNPLSETFIACDLAAGRAHLRLLQGLKADVTVEEGELGAGVHLQLDF